MDDGTQSNWRVPAGTRRIASPVSAGQPRGPNAAARATFGRYLRSGGATVDVFSPALSSARRTLPEASASSMKEGDRVLSSSGSGSILG